MAPNMQGHRQVLSANFNQDFSCLALGTGSWYAIFRCDPFGCIFHQADAPSAFVEMLFSTSLVAVVPINSSQSEHRNDQNTVSSCSSAERLKIVNTKRQSTICELAFPTRICRVTMNRRRLAVVLEEAIFVYDISNMKLLATLDTKENQAGICALCSSSDTCYLAYSAKSGMHAGDRAGYVQVYDSLTLETVTMISAHRSPLTCLAFNAQGTLLATAGQKGTIVRVYSVPSGRLLYQFRRGTYPAHISNMAFNTAGTMLVVTSDTDTIHLFQLTHPQDQASEYDMDQVLERKRSKSYWRNWQQQSAEVGKSVVGSVGGWLPGSLAEIWEPKRDFAHVKLPHTGVGTVAAMHSTLPRVMVIALNGKMYVYDIDMKCGGEGTLIEQYDLMERDSS
ncbi:autophagy protein [Malassezia yamatoensis]|uniref:Autophagy protein n=1 Tax=Malassezia yamatoensis TaxID=253288 RepID=A0AAJ5YVJ8_9BASI|nr:autophagy protein [Malassezia yamatoensis]